MPAVSSPFRVVVRLACTPVWEPTGPLPATVYWRRRALAGVLTVGVVALVGSMVTGATAEPEPPAEPVAASLPVADRVPACTDSLLDIAAGLDADEHRVGDKPVLRLIVTNTGPQPCVRDLDPTRQEITVWSADLRERLWSSNDCSGAAARADERTLQPNQPLAFPVRWAGRTSAQGCPADRSAVPAGTYQLRGRLDTITGDPTEFRRLD